MNHIYHESPAVMQLRLDLENIRFYLSHSSSDQHREQLYAAVKKVFREWDAVNERAAG